MKRMQLDMTQLGTTGMQITRVGFGAWGLELTPEDISEIEGGT